MKFKTEEEFLKAYNPNDFDRLSITVDTLLFSVSSEQQTNYRKLSLKNFSILLVKRNDFPFKDKWCLPGGFIGIDEELDKAANRVLENETNLKNIYMEQLYTYGGVKRDPRMRIVSVAYMALVDKTKLNDKLNEEASWFDVKILTVDDDINITLDNGTTVLSLVVKRKLSNVTSNRYEYKIIKNNDLAFDHALVILEGIERLKNKIEYTDIVFNMMPKYFTLGELQQVYEVILNKKLLDPAFRRIIADKVVKTDKFKTGGGHRPSALFTYRGNYHEGD